MRQGVMAWQREIGAFSGISTSVYLSSPAKEEANSSELVERLTKRLTAKLGQQFAESPRLEQSGRRKLRALDYAG